MRSKITLTLSQDEAQALVDLCQFVGGNPATTRRRFIDQIQERLIDRGVPVSECEDVSGSVAFDSQPCVTCGRKG
jgi:hypothetical protein